jgi:hypothetical protein
MTHPSAQHSRTHTHLVNGRRDLPLRRHSREVLLTEVGHANGAREAIGLDLLKDLPLLGRAVLGYLGSGASYFGLGVRLLSAVSSRQYTYKRAVDEVWSQLYPRPQVHAHMST